MTPPTPGFASELNERFRGAHPQEILLWAFDNIPDLVIGTSFQLGGLVNLFFAKEIVDPVPVLFLQTGFHFPETLEFRDRIVSEWGLELIETAPTLGPERQARELGAELYRTDPDLCCNLNKVLPLQNALADRGGWATGIRRDQAPTRANTEVFEIDEQGHENLIWKVNPLAHWTRDQVRNIAREYDMPHHPLFAKGYTSIGCAPCTRPAGGGEEERAGRWDGLGKTECGIHSNNGNGSATAGSSDVRGTLERLGIDAAAL